MKILFVLLILISKLSWAGCLMDHLQEGVAHNQARKLIYSRLTNGATERVSDLLINYELNLIWLLKITRFERNFHNLCDEFESSPNPALPELSLENPKLKSFQPISVRDLRRKLKTNDLDLFYRVVVTEIEGLLLEPRLNCMTRHVLESMARVAGLAKQDSAKTHESFRLLGLMQWALYGAKQLDVMASKHQATGIPILCADLPVIEYKF